MSEAPASNDPATARGGASGSHRPRAVVDPARARIVLALLALVFLGLAFGSARLKSVTVDELGHLPAGVYTLARGDVRHATLNPPLLNALAALPVFALSLDEPIEPPAASDDVFAFWSTGYHFHERHRADYLRIYAVARAVPILLALALGWLVFHWANAVARGIGDGASAPWAGLLAASLLWFSPNWLAHTRIIGTDTGTAAFLLFALYALRRYLLRPAYGTALLFGVVLGLAQLTKLYALLFYPVTLLVVLCAWRWRGRPASLGEASLHCAAAFGISLLVLNAGYGFAEFGRSLASLPLQSETGRALQASWLGALPLPLPAAYLRAFDGQWVEVTSGLRAYLLGESFQGGRIDYYLIVLVLKTSLVGLAAFAATLGAQVARVRIDRTELVLLLSFPIALFCLLSLGDNRQLGLRALLAGYPMICVWMGAVLAAVLPLRWRLRGVGVWVAASLATAAIAFPDYLAHFNPLVGGRDAGYRLASDANIDIGQDLVGLAAYLDEVEAGPVQLFYFGSVDPALYGIDYRVPTDYRLAPGYVAISVSLYRMSYDVYDHGVLRKVGPVDVSGLGEPVAQIGGSIHVYRLEDRPGLEGGAG